MEVYTVYGCRIHRCLLLTIRFFVAGGFEDDLRPRLVMVFILVDAMYLYCEIYGVNDPQKGTL